jgi:hypothetical protein
VVDVFKKINEEKMIKKFDEFSLKENRYDEEFEEQYQNMSDSEIDEEEQRLLQILKQEEEEFYHQKENEDDNED